MVMSPLVCETRLYNLMIRDVRMMRERDGLRRRKKWAFGRSGSKGAHSMTSRCLCELLHSQQDTRTVEGVVCRVKLHLTAYHVHNAAAALSELHVSYPRPPI